VNNWFVVIDVSVPVSFLVVAGVSILHHCHGKSDEVDFIEFIK